MRHKVPLNIRSCHILKWTHTQKNTQTEKTYWEKGLHDISFDRAQGFVLDYHEDLLLFLQIDEIPKPRFFRKSKKGKRKHNQTRSKNPPQTKIKHEDDSAITNEWCVTITIVLNIEQNLPDSTRHAF